LSENFVTIALLFFELLIIQVIIIFYRCTKSHYPVNITWLDFSVA